jgi:hypothetical protein
MASLVMVGLELTAFDHFPNAPVRHPEDPGGLAGRVSIFLHMGSIPLPEAFAPVLGAVKRRQALTFGK